MSVIDRPLGFVASVLLVLSSTPAAASTIVVDASGSGQFTDIPPAIAAAQSGDVLLVLAGTYSPFTLDKGLTIIGYGGASVGGPIAITSVAAPGHAAVVDLGYQGFSIAGCSAPIVLQNAVLDAPCTISQCTDVRLRAITVHAPDATTAVPAFDVVSSRAEIAESTCHGSNGAVFATFTVNGGDGVAAEAGSRVHFARSSAGGGAGSGSGINFFSGNGGSAAHLYAPNAVMILAGGGASNMIGGAGGGNFAYSDCGFDGLAGAGIFVEAGATLLYSGANVVAQDSFVGLHCVPLPGQPFVGPHTPVIPDDPTLAFTGVPTAGQTVTFTLFGDPLADSAILYFGRQAIVVPDPNTEIELLTPKARIVHLGAIPASGHVSFTWPIAPSLAPGVFLVAQGETTNLVSGAMRRTNSVPIVVR
jgi:hypothetical protein